jgi:putative restriction endonuclease
VIIQKARQRVERLIWSFLDLQMNSLSKYLQIFKKLRIDRSHGLAPHKPILLLSVLQLYHSKLLLDKRVFITPELVALFKANWTSLVKTNHDCRISYPFYYLKSDRFWQLVPKSGFENIDQMGSIMKSFSNLNAAVDFAVIDSELFLLMIDKRSNEILQQFIIDEFFPESNTDFNSLSRSQGSLFNSIEVKILCEPPAEYRKEIEKLMQQNNEEEIYLRGSMFKREIPKIYNNTCSISGMKVDSVFSFSMIDACHIVPFSNSYNDTISNGIALCPNLHRAFDRGLISIDNNYKVLVSQSFRENLTNYSINAFIGRELHLPKNESYHPSKSNIEWHRNNIFKP